MSDSDEKKRKFDVRIAIAGIAIGVLGWIASKEATSISRQTHERETGRSVADFELNCETKHLEVIANTPIEPKSMQIEVKNNGPNAIQAIRCEISTHVTWAGDKAEKQNVPPGKFEHEFSEILKPGEKGTVEILPSVVAYMKTLSPPPGKDYFYSPCRVACSAKLVGAEYFTSKPKLRTGDGDTAANFVSFGMTWKASDKVQMETLNFGISR